MRGRSHRELAAREMGIRIDRRNAAVCWAILVAAACAHAGEAEGPPLEDPAAAAQRAYRTGGAEVPSQLRFRWEYADERGPLRGEGVARINPPDSVRLDLFGPGEGAMAVALVDSRLRSRGQIEDLSLPPAPFLYATAGLYRPGRESPARGYRSDEFEVLVYPGASGGFRRYYLEEDRIRRIEEARDGRIVRRLEVTWPETGDWPEGAEFEDRTARHRARWELRNGRAADESHPPEIYDLPEEGG